jgi:ankyrin repeat protein
MRACQEGHADITCALLAVNVEVNRKNHEGMNALMLASQRGHADIVYQLIKAGAVMDEQTSQGKGNGSE